MQQQRNAEAVFDQGAESSSHETTLNMIDQLPVSSSWKNRFKAIAKAGGPKLPNLKSLPSSERRKAFSFNFLAFLFGPLYYIAKGMYRRGLLLLCLCVVAMLVLAFIMVNLGLERYLKFFSYACPVLFAMRANIDYYKKMVLNDNGWW